MLMAAVSLCVIIVGLILGIAFPGPITGSLFPIGLTLWWATGAFARYRGFS